MSEVSNKKICFICSCGGHLEQIRQLKKVMSKYEYFLVTTKNNSTEKIKEKKYFISDLYRGKNKIIKLINLCKMFMQQFVIFIKEKPKYIVTTGAGIVIPMCLIGKIFNSKVIYIESFARINSSNKTGKFLYKYADLFIVQWKNLLEIYPNAIYGGWIY